jgi:nucleotide-binding universal stress UspA family protein
MMKILVALDRSEKDRPVVASAAALARAAGAHVVLVNVFSPWKDTALSTASTPKERLEELAAERQSYLEEQAHAFAGLTVTARTEALRRPPGRRTDAVAEAVACVARECAAYVLVVGRTPAAGPAGPAGRPLGSTTQALLHLSPCPVLVVHPTGAGTRAPPRLRVGLRSARAP